MLILVAERPSPVHGLLSFSPPLLSCAPLLPCVCVLAPLDASSLLARASVALFPAASSSLARAVVAAGSQQRGDKKKAIWITCTILSHCSEKHAGYPEGY